MIYVVYFGVLYHCSLLDNKCLYEEHGVRVVQSFHTYPQSHFKQSQYAGI